MFNFKRWEKFNHNLYLQIQTYRVTKENSIVKRLAKTKRTQGRNIIDKKKKRRKRKPRLKNKVMKN